jgi:hypothetical protein
VLAPAAEAREEKDRQLVVGGGVGSLGRS